MSSPPVFTRPNTIGRLLRSAIYTGSAVLALLLGGSGADRSLPGTRNPHAVPAEVTAEINNLAPNCEAMWSQPVTAPITDGYRPPSSPYGSGNRGLEYGTESGDTVSVVADGSVRFAGQVGGSLFVVVTHPSGLVSTYGFVEQVLPSVGDAVNRGQTIAIAGPGLHLSARIAGRYRDPTPLLQTTCYRVRLVPLPVGFSTS